MMEAEALWQARETVFLPRAPRNEEKSVFVAVNGRAYQVPRGRAVEVPVPVAQVLQSARRAAEAAESQEAALEA